MKKSKTYAQQEKELPIVAEQMAVYNASIGYSSIDDKGVLSIIDSINRGISFATFEDII